jgi:hypothetical protein
MKINVVYLLFLENVFFVYYYLILIIFLGGKLIS